MSVLEDFAPKFGIKENWLLHHNTRRLTFPFSSGNVFLYQKQHVCRRPPFPLA
jgi:hypothetical protein